VATLSIGDVAERTGIAAGTIRMWEQRYGVPTPTRTPGGYRAYTEADVELLRRAAAYRTHGLSVGAALGRAQEAGGESDRPSIFAAVSAAAGSPATHVLTKPTMLALSRAIEDETIAHSAAPLCFGAFQEERFYRPVAHRYARIAQIADATVVFADFAGRRRASAARAVTELPIGDGDALGSEWALVVDAPGYAAALLGWERADVPDPADSARRFECLWTIDPETVRRASLVAARIAGGIDSSVGERLDDLLADRPLAIETPAPALTALTNRMVSYLDEG
jgi:MerR family transcriptional regulator, light-induced transcriptional regulator